MQSNTTPIRYQETWIRLVYKLVDAVAIATGLTTVLVWLPTLNSDASIISCLLAIGLFSIVAEFFRLHRNWQGIAIESEITCSILAWGTTLICLIVLGRFTAYATEFSGTALLFWFALTPIYSIALRISFRRLQRWLFDRGINTRGYAIVGATDVGFGLARNIERSPDMGLKFMGFYDDRPGDRIADGEESFQERLGDFTTLIEHAKANRVSTVFITLPMRAEERIRDVIARLSDSTISVYVVPDLFVFQLLHSRWTDVHGIPIVSVFENPLYGVDGVLKRACDLTLAAIGLVFLALPMLLIAAMVKLTSKGPVFFRQRRYGLDGREFFVWKYRSMTVCEDGDTVTQATKNDSRLTPIGGFLRRSSLDELPQLFNVIAGNMSLVGPRPHATAHNELYREQIEGYMLRHKIKPGITGLAQVEGFRGETDTLEKMEGRIKFDHQYIREWSLWLDLRILFRTFFVVFSRQNAY